MYRTTHPLLIQVVPEALATFYSCIAFVKAISQDHLHAEAHCVSRLELLSGFRT